MEECFRPKLLALESARQMLDQLVPIHDISSLVTVKGKLLQKGEVEVNGLGQDDIPLVLGL
jgi:hypothetical protein